MIQYGMRWPLASIDFEASALDDDSYPIEIGVAIWRGPMAPIVTWSSLIEPTPEWVRDGVWFEKAQKVHGISPADLIGAPRPQTVMATLSRFMTGIDAVVTDNVRWDGFWMRRLEDAAGMRAGLRIEGVIPRMEDMNVDARIGVSDYHSRHPRPHRAGPDATMQLAAMAAGLRRDVEFQEWRRN